MRKLHKIIVALIFITALLFKYYPENYLLMLVKSFAFQIMCAFGLLTMWYALKRKWVASVIGIVSVLIINTMMPPVLTLNEGDITGYEGIKVAHFNVLKYNRDHASTVEKALECDADLLSFQEVDPLWAETLTTSLQHQYPYFKVVSQTNCYGLAVFSKHPFHEVEAFYAGEVPNIGGSIEVHGVRFNFISSHTRSPGSVERYRQRNHHIAALANYLQEREGPKLAIGDYNSVPWDRHIIKFKGDTNMYDSRKSLAATYPSFMKIAQIPIDYIFHSSEFECLGFQTIKGTSSDHLGIMGVYQFKQLNPHNS